MEIPKIKRSEHGMLESIKSKLGFAQPDYGYNDDYDNQDYDNDYGEYGSDYQDDSYSASSGYDSYSSTSSRGTNSTRNQVTSRPAGYTPAKLVSIDDVRARTQIPAALNRDPLPARHVTTPSSSFRGGRMMVDSDTPISQNTPNARAAAAQDRERSESLNALFTSTTSESQAVSNTAAKASSSDALGLSNAGGSFAAHLAKSTTRSLTVLKPVSYAEAERVAKSLKAGDVVVIVLRNTPDNLSKRILDFTFGVSCALEAQVDCIADKVFVIARGEALTDSERISLRSQGVL